MRRSIKRRLTFWRYSVSHSQLLLMSPKDAENSTRVYVLLKGVEAIASETTFDCDYVEMDGGADLDGGFVASMHESGDVRMVGPHGVQTLRAFAVYFGEDELEYGDPVPVGIF